MPVKVWITGYSRGAAVSNLSAALLIQSGIILPENMFAYSFATPNNTLSADARGEAYRGLYPVIGAFDPVLQAPPSAWGFTRCGRTLTLPGAESDSDHAVFYEKADAWSRAHPGIPFYYSTFVNYTAEKILDAAVLLFAVTLALSVVRSLRGRVRRASVTLAALPGVLFVPIQLSRTFLPARDGFRAVFKGMASLTVLTECLLCTLQHKRRRDHLMLAGFLCCIVNDVVINYSLQWGMAAAMTGTLLFIAAFPAGGKPLARAGEAAAALLTAAGLVLLFRFRAQRRADRRQSKKKARREARSSGK